MAFETHLFHIIVPGIFLVLFFPGPGIFRNAHPSQFHESPIELWVIGGNHPPLSGRHILHSMKTEASEISHGAQFLPFIRPATTMGRILDNPNVPLFGYLQNRIHIACMPSIVDGYNGFCLWSNILSNFPRINIEGIWFNVRKDRNPSIIKDGMIGGVESDRGGYHVLSFL